MPTDQLTYGGTLVVVRCWCGIRMGMPAELDRAQNLDKLQVAYCPLGHEFVRSGPSREEKRAKELARDLERERQRVARLTSELDQETAALRHERNSARALKGHLTRIRRRIANGVCPVPECRRSGFAQVVRHIKAKHPEWHAEHAHEIVVPPPG